MGAFYEAFSPARAPSRGCFTDHNYKIEKLSLGSSLHGISRDLAWSRKDYRSVKDPKTLKMVSRCVTWASAPQRLPMSITGSSLGEA